MKSHKVFPVMVPHLGTSSADVMEIVPDIRIQIQGVFGAEIHSCIHYSSHMFIGVQLPQENIF